MDWLIQKFARVGTALCFSGAFLCFRPREHSHFRARVPEDRSTEKAPKLPGTCIHKALINKDAACRAATNTAQQESGRVRVQKHHKYSPTAKGPLQSFTKSHHRNNLQANNAEQLHSKLCVKLYFRLSHFIMLAPPGWHWTNACQVQ